MKFILAIIALSLLAAPARAQNGVAPNPDLLTACNRAAIYDGTTNGDTRLVVGNAASQIYICGFNFFSGGTATVKLEYGTGGSCGTGTNRITPGYQFTAQTGDVDHSPVYGGLLPVPASNDLCINVNAGVAVQAIVYFAQF